MDEYVNNRIIGGSIVNEVTRETSGNKNDFIKRLDMLATTLSLNEDRKLISLEKYRLLFSTYKKMIETDVDHFFLEKQKQSKVVESLQRSQDFLTYKNHTLLWEAFGKMRSDDPTDFMLFSVLTNLVEDEHVSPQFFGLIVYKKENKLIVVKVDSEEQFSSGQVSYAKIPVAKAEMLSKIIYFERDSLNPRPFSLLKDIELLSEGFQVIPALTIGRQGMDHSKTKEVEDTLKVLLFHCRTDIFSLDTAGKVTPVWNPFVNQANLEMRKRFLEAVKGENKTWNEVFDHVFDYYLYRIGEKRINPLLPSNNQHEWWNRSIQNIFARDPYILTMIATNGKDQTSNEAILKNRLEWAVQPTALLYDQVLTQVKFKKLTETLYLDGIMMQMYEDRLTMIKSPVAKEMTKRILSRLDDRYDDINSEIKRRIMMQRKQSDLKRESQWQKVLPMNLEQKDRSNFIKKEELKQKQKQDFKRRMDMLALTLSLKRNDDSFLFPEVYELLFSTYIKMIETDKDGFFIDEKRQANIIASLNQSNELNQLKQANSIQSMLEKLRNNDSTDFLLIPACFKTLDPVRNGHISGLIVYKRENEFMVMQVDKEETLKTGALSYVKIPMDKIQEFSRVLFSARDFYEFKPYGILKRIESLSHRFKEIPTIKLAPQTTGNCGIIEMEAALRVALFYCKKDLFDLQLSDRITPKWNTEVQDLASLEMKRRFVEAMKGDNQEWNLNFDYLFGYYIYRKNQSKQSEAGNGDLHKYSRYGDIRILFGNDLYIDEIMNNGGRIPLIFDCFLKGKIIQSVGPTGTLLGKEICVIATSDLYKELQSNVNELKMLEERLPYIKIPVAKEMAKYFIACLVEKNKEIESHICERIGIESKTCSYQVESQSTVDSFAKVSQSQLTPAGVATGASAPLTNQFATMIHRSKQASAVKNQCSVSKKTKCKKQVTVTK